MDRNEFREAKVTQNINCQRTSGYICVVAEPNNISVHVKISLMLMLILIKFSFQGIEHSEEKNLVDKFHMFFPYIIWHNTT